MQRETQVSSSAGRIGDPAGLFDVRLGKDVHVAMGCGLGGTSLINANVCLEADPRVFEDPCWPAPVLRDGLLAEGLTRARAMLAPQALSGPAQALEARAARRLRQGARWGAYPAAVAHRLRARHQRRRRRAARVRAVRRLLRRLQRRRQDHHGADLFAGRGTRRRRNLHARRGALADEAEGRQVAHQHRHAPRKRLGDPHGAHGKRRRAGRGHAGLDRNPAQIPNRRAGALGAPGRAIHHQRRCARQRLQQRFAPSTASASAIPPRPTPSPWAPPWPAWSTCAGPRGSRTAWRWSRRRSRAARQRSCRRCSPRADRSSAAIPTSRLPMSSTRRDARWRACSRAPTRAPSATPRPSSPSVTIPGKAACGSRRTGSSSTGPVRRRIRFSSGSRRRSCAQPRPPAAPT